MFQYIIDNVPDYKKFFTVNEMDESTKKLAEKYPDTVKVFEAGKSKKGHPIYCMKIGNGSKNAFAYGCPHPNEPIGAMMLEYLSECLAKDKNFRDKLDYTWYIIKCSDPDGTIMNEGWFKGPFTLYNYARNYYRPASYLQAEWTFPIKYKNLEFNDTIPETQALINVIDLTKPDFIYSLHNGGFGGAYWYINRDMPEIYEKLNEAASKNEVPLDLGEPEAPYAKLFGTAIYQDLDIKDEYDYFEKYSSSDPSKIIKTGTSSSSYANEIGNTFTLVSEVPYFYDPRIDDVSESDMLRKEAIMKTFDYEEDLVRIIRKILNMACDYISEDNPFKITLTDFYLDEQASRREAREEFLKGNTIFNMKAKVSEKFSSIYVSRFFHLLALGLLVRAPEWELINMDAAGEINEDKHSTLVKAKIEAENELKKLNDVLDKEMNYSVIPIRSLVRVQLESGLIVASNLNKRQR